MAKIFLPGGFRHFARRDIDGLAEGVAVDVHRSQSLARRLIDHDATPSEEDIGAHAVSPLSNELLPGWYDDWALIAGEDWRQLRLHALEAVASRLTAADRLAEAAAAEVLPDIEPR